MNSTSYERLQRWRRRQRARWPGLFAPSIGTFSTDISCEARKELQSSTLIVQFHRDRSSQILINKVPIILCDGCAALQPLAQAQTSSASTQSPQSQPALTGEEFVRCDTCAFTTPLGHLRRLLSLPSCGPSFPVDVAFSLLVEAVGAPAAIKSSSDEHTSWFLDTKCRERGLDALLIALGLCDEQLCTSPQAFVDHIPLINYCLETERFIDNHASHPDIPHIQYSVTDLLVHAKVVEYNQADIAAKRSSTLIAEANQIWKNILSSSETVKYSQALHRLGTIGREFFLEQAKARQFNHNLRPIPASSFYMAQSDPLSNHDVQKEQ